MVDLTPNYVGSLERGEALPTVQTLLELARALGTSPAQLLGEDDGHDEWIDRIVALAQAVPHEDRPLVLALMHAVSTTRRGAPAERAIRAGRRRT